MTRRPRRVGEGRCVSQKVHDGTPDAATGETALESPAKFLGIPMSFTGLVIVSLVSFVAPLLLGFFPKIRLPAIVLEILAGIAIGPAGFGIVEIDEPISVMSVIGLSFLLFLAGLELEVKLLRGRRLTLSLAGFVLSVAIA